MIRAREADVEKAVNAYCKTKGITSQKQNGLGDRGKSDRLLMRNGVAAFLELKRPGQKPTELQLRYLRMRKEDGFAAAWADSFHMAKEWIDRVFP